MSNTLDMVLETLKLKLGAAPALPAHVHVVKSHLGGMPDEYFIYAWAKNIDTAMLISCWVSTKDLPGALIYIGSLGIEIKITEK